MKKHKLTLIVEADDLEDFTLGVAGLREAIGVGLHGVLSGRASWDVFNQEFTMTNEDAPPDATRQMKGSLHHITKYEEYESLEFNEPEEGAPSVEEGTPALEEGASV